MQCKFLVTFCHLFNRLPSQTEPFLTKFYGKFRIFWIPADVFMDFQANWSHFREILGEASAKSIKFEIRTFSYFFTNFLSKFSSFLVWFKDSLLCFWKPKLFLQNSKVGLHFHPSIWTLFQDLFRSSTSTSILHWWIVLKSKGSRVEFMGKHKVVKVNASSLETKDDLTSRLEFIFHWFLLYFQPKKQKNLNYFTFDFCFASVSLLFCRQSKPRTQLRRPAGLSRQASRAKWREIWKSFYGTYD